MEKIILASGSPRRKELLEKYNLKPIIIKSNLIEKESPGETPEQVTMSLAFNKAFSVSKEFQEQIVIGADTVIVYNNSIIGKPKDEDDAYRILSMLSGKQHYVITGISIINTASNIKIVDYEKTLVKFRNITSDRISSYILTKEPMDKAGAYGIQGIGAILVEKIDGCYSNVVGLPLSKIDYHLEKHFNINIL